MEKKSKLDNIELRSEEVQEILGRAPKWMIRYGIAVIFIVIAGLFIGSYFFKYPEIIPATITVTTENLPVGLTAKVSGRVDSLFVEEKQSVKKGDYLALIENPASFKDVLYLKEFLSDFTIDSLHSDLDIRNNLILGDIQASYSSFLKAFADLQYFIKTDYHAKKIRVIEKQIITQKQILKKSQHQLYLSTLQLSVSSELFAMDSVLFTKKALSAADYENAKNTYLQQQQSNESAKLVIDNQQLSILQLEQSVFDLEQQWQDQKNQYVVTLGNGCDQLKAQIKNWDQLYVLVSPIEGLITMTRFWQKNQNVTIGEVLLTVVPQKETEIIGKIVLPYKGAGKVKVGQMVNVKFDNYPYMEFGMVRVQIQNIALVPISEKEVKGYVLEVNFPEKLKTNYGKELDFSQEMMGVAEIITEDFRLIDRFLNPIRAILKR